MVDALWQDESTAWMPSACKRALERKYDQFQGYKQHDAQELLRSLLYGVHDNLNQADKVQWQPAPNYDVITAAAARWEATRDFCQSRDSSLILDQFQGWLSSTLTCNVCQHASSSFEPFLDLSLPVPDSNTAVSLEACLQNFRQAEVGLPCCRSPFVRMDYDRCVRPCDPYTTFINIV